jgi:hypothetical protein
VVFGTGQLQAQSIPSKKDQIPQGNGNSSVKGSGTIDRLAKWVGADEIGDSAVVETAGNVAIGATPSTTFKLLVNATLSNPGVTLRATNFGDGRAIQGNSVGGTGIVGGGAVIGVAGVTIDGFAAVSGSSQNGIGVSGNSTNADGVHGVSGSTDPTFAAIRGLAGNGAFAGRFTGDVLISGTLSKGGGSFKIDHPLDPENKYLYHSFVESPDMMNIYNGNLTTNENGDAVVTLPDYFEALNGDFRYQLTVIGTFAQAIVAEKIKGNRFAIKTNAPNVEVSWQVTGVRQDAFANKNRIKVEVEKDQRERGFYLHPEAFNKTEERSVEWAHRPELMLQLKQQRVEGAQPANPQKPGGH